MTGNPDDILVREKTCDLCKQTTGTGDDDTIHFGDWMTRSDITTHYYCLLLATNLPQRGEDHSGILGFLLRDIRKEINAAKQRVCIYCEKKSATIMCCKCKRYFHLTCGHTNRCLYEFVGEFKSYCKSCLPLDDEQERLMSNPRAIETNCYICSSGMGCYRPYTWIRAKCCNNGYVHSLCMKKYALTAGYYLKCIWCKNKSFRDYIKYLGIFVPDRDANWEREEGAYRDLHRPNTRCDMDKCHCDKGRAYNTSKWIIIKCKLCGLVGAHNPFCIPGLEYTKRRVDEFKCDTCSVTEHTVADVVNESRMSYDEVGDINVTLYVNKGCNASTTEPKSSDNTLFSEDSVSSMDTVINTGKFSQAQGNNAVCVPLLTQSSDEAVTATVPIEDEPHQVTQINNDVVSLLTQSSDEVVAAPAPVPIEDEPHKVTQINNDVVSLLTQSSDEAVAAPAPVPIEDEPHQVTQTNNDVVSLLTQDIEEAVAAPVPVPIEDEPHQVTQTNNDVVSLLTQDSEEAVAAPVPMEVEEHEVIAGHVASLSLQIAAAEDDINQPIPSDDDDDPPPYAIEMAINHLLSFFH